LALLVIAGIALLLTHGRAEREHMWAGMARESAHQIGTPLSSLHGWIEVLMERAGDPLVDSAIGHMQGDIERLERVSHRFERIGRPPKLESVDVRASVERVVDYFRARVPTLATPVRLAVDIRDDGLTVPADRVLIEWVLETLIKNAIDALSGAGGKPCANSRGRRRTRRAAGTSHAYFRRRL
jgi:signal transduction histidine kinase